MPTLKLKLEADDDRIVNLEVTDQHGEVYRVGLEFLGHHFEVDEVQVRVTKPGGSTKKGLRAVRSPNRVLFNEKTVGHRKDGSHIYGAWFEFHEVDSYPRVLSEPWEED